MLSPRYDARLHLSWARQEQQFRRIRPPSRRRRSDGPWPSRRASRQEHVTARYRRRSIISHLPARLNAEDTALLYLCASLCAEGSGRQRQRQDRRPALWPPLTRHDPRANVAGELGNYTPISRADASKDMKQFASCGPGQMNCAQQRPRRRRFWASQAAASVLAARRGGRGSRAPGRERYLNGAIDDAGRIAVWAAIALQHLVVMHLIAQRGSGALGRRVGK